MKVLFLDTTVKADIGLFQDNQFVEFEVGPEEKSSHKFHYRIYQLLERNNFKLKDIDIIFQLAGPGSYTGMRLSEGFAGIVEMEGIKTYSIYHYEIPHLAGEVSYQFVSNAFKNEMFVYTYENGQENKRLVKKDELVVEKEQIYSHEDFADIKTQNTLVLLKENPSIIKTCIENKIRRELYYYRSIEEEFKVKEKQA